MVRYHDVFWSNDYLSGINSLLSNLEKGQNQSQVCLEYFQKYSEIIDLQGDNLTQISSLQQKYTDSHQEQPLTRKESQFISENFLGSDINLKSINDLILQQSQLTKEQSLDRYSLISKLESDVILPLKDFIHNYKEFEAQAKRDLNSSHKEYRKSIQTTNSLKSKYEAKSRYIEDLTVTSPDSELLPEKDETKELPPSPKEESITEIAEDPIFEFPLSIGGLTVETVNALREILSAMIDEIPIKRRLIPIPGINNEYFKSEDFTQWVRLNLSKQDTTSKIERFGQDLINLGLVTNWNKLTQNLFVSDSGYYYEFTDLAKYTSRFDEENEQREQEKELAASTAAAVQSTSFTSTSNVWNGIKNKFSTPKDIGAFKEQLEQIRISYFNSFNESIDLKFALESKILLFLKKAEFLQKSRISLVHKLQKTFNERIIESQKTYLSQIETLQQSITEFDNENSDLEMLKSISRGSSGWYWPVSDTKFIDYNNRTTTVEIFDTDIVNLYIDETNEDYKTKSIPFFLYQIISKLNEESDIGECWTGEIDFSIAKKIKKNILNQLFLLGNSAHPAGFKIKTIVDYLFKRYEANDIITFLKFWFLELPDSLLPFTVYDSLTHLYGTGETKNDTNLHIIGSIPRQNLATLLFLITHLQDKLKSPVDQLSKNSNFPFIHLLLRPSSSKFTYLDVTDSLPLFKLSIDLFDNTLQQSLYEKLESLETYHLEKMKRAETSLNEYKTHKRQESNLASLSNIQKSKPASVADVLKPFKTQTPMDTPMASPRQSRSNSGSFNIKTNLLSPTTLKRPSDNINKRLSKNLDQKAVPDIPEEEKKEKVAAPALDKESMEENV